MELLVSNRAGSTSGLDFFFKKFANVLPLSNKVLIAVGYISSEALAYLNGIVRKNPDTFDELNLWIGMGLQRSQLGGVEVLDETLQEMSLGSVHIVNDWPYHGKVYLFGEQGALTAGMIGSSNLSAIIENHNLVELDIFFEDENLLSSTENFIKETLNPASIPFDDFSKELPKGDKKLPHTGVKDFYADISEERLDILKGVSSVSRHEITKIQSALLHKQTFTHRLKVGTRHTRSNLNAYHGQGRLVRTRGGKVFYRPRPWYEAELILSQDERESFLTPPNIFRVVTDDGWSFEMKRQGDYQKNLRSLVDLRPLGKWIKGRLEDAGALRPGDLITEHTLAEYGCDLLKFTPIDDGTGRWYMDFSNGDESLGHKGQ